MRATRCVLGLILALVSAVAAGAADVPALAGRVVDQAGLLSGEQRAAIEQKLADFEQQTGVQVAVLTIDTLGGETIEEFGIKVAESWRLGRKEQDDGVLFTIAKNDRKMRIDVGYGLESKLTDVLTARIQENVVRPAFRAGDYPGGIAQGVDAIIGALSGVPNAVPEAPAESSPVRGPLLPRLMAFGIYLLVTGVFSIIALTTKGSEAWFLYFFLMPFHLLFPLVLHPLAGPAIFGGWVLLFPLVRLWMRLTGRVDRFLPKFDPSTWRSSGSGGGSWSSSSWSSGSSGSSGGSSFSGGGGSFGGGGSSSSW